MWFGFGFDKHLEVRTQGTASIPTTQHVWWSGTALGKGPSTYRKAVFSYLDVLPELPLLLAAHQAEAAVVEQVEDVAVDDDDDQRRPEEDRRPHHPEL